MWQSILGFLVSGPFAMPIARIFLALISVNRGEKLRAQIVIGTPGTLLDWCMKFKVIDLRKVNVFVLDEADVMIDTQGHQDQSIRIQRWVGLTSFNLFRYYVKTVGLHPVSWRLLLYLIWNSRVQRHCLFNNKPFLFGQLDKSYVNRKDWGLILRKILDFS